MISALLFAALVVALLFGVLAFIMATVALILVYGMKNSTHQVVWKPVTPPEDSEDPFASFHEEEELGVNPNKKISKVAKAEDDVDLSDPAVTSNDWQ